MLQAPTRRGYRIVGPTSCDGAIVLDESEPEPVRPDDLRWFGFAHEQGSSKCFLFPTREVIGRVEADEPSVRASTGLGGSRPLLLLAGEQFPRIC